MKIVQIATHQDSLFGLDEDGELYVLEHKNLGFGRYKPTWTRYLDEYGIDRPVIEQVVSYITGYCYTSSNLFESIKENFVADIDVVTETAQRMHINSKDMRVLVAIEKTLVKVKIEEDTFKAVQGIEITVVHRPDGKEEVVLLANKQGGKYERA